MSYFGGEYLTWRCDICHRERPDDCISVHKVDLTPPTYQQRGIMVRNVKYCNDKYECQQGAEHWGEHNALP